MCCINISSVFGTVGWRMVMTSQNGRIYDLIVISYHTKITFICIYCKMDIINLLFRLNTKLGDMFKYLYTSAFITQFSYIFISSQNCNIAAHSFINSCYLKISLLIGFIFRFSMWLIVIATTKPDTYSELTGAFLK